MCKIYRERILHSYCYGHIIADVVKDIGRRADVYIHIFCFSFIVLPSKYIIGTRICNCDSFSRINLNVNNSYLFMYKHIYIYTHTYSLSTPVAIVDLWVDDNCVDKQLRQDSVWKQKEALVDFFFTQWSLQYSIDIPFFFSVVYFYSSPA